MLSRSSKTSATSRAARKAEKTQSAKFSLRFGLQAIDQANRTLIHEPINEDDETIEDPYTDSGQDSDEQVTWSNEAREAEHSDGDAASNQQSQHDAAPSPETWSDIDSQFIKGAQYQPNANFLPKEAPSQPSTTAPSNRHYQLEELVPKEPDRFNESSSTVAARSRNSHTRTTISDDRSKDSDIKARFLLALRSRNENSPQNTVSSPFGATTNPTAATSAGGNHALQDYQMQLKLLDQQNKKRLMMARQEQDNMMPKLPHPSDTSGLTGLPRLTGFMATNDQLSKVSTMEEPTELYREWGFRATGDPPRLSSFATMNSEPFAGWDPRSGLKTEPMHPTMDGRESSNHTFSESLEKTTETANFLDISTAGEDLGHKHLPSSNDARVSNEELDKLLTHIETLQKSADAMKIAMRESEPPQYKILYRLGHGESSNVYLDAPQWANGQKDSKVLKSSLPLWDVPAYLEQYPSIAFVVYRQYDEKSISNKPGTDGTGYDGSTGIAPIIQHTGESIYIVSKDLVFALTEFLKAIGGFMEVAESISHFQEIKSPYLFIYHSRNVVNPYLQLIPDQRRKRLSCLLEHVYSTFRDEYEEVDELLQRRKIRVQYIKYLFRTGEILVEKQDNNIRGVCSSSELSEGSVRKTSNKKDNPLAEYPHLLSSMFRKPEQVQKKKPDNCATHSWKLSAWSWKFDGAFSRTNSNHELTLDVYDDQKHSEVDIDDLNLFPLAFADEATKTLLQKRGEMFWKCRFRHLVSYRDDEDCGLDRSADERFMIDLMTYRELHKQHIDEKKGNVPEAFTDDLGPEAMKQENPPDDKFVYLLPMFVKGFNLQRKRWVDLEVDRMSEVVWNKKAFMSLVLANKTKELLQALIVNQLDSEKSTDLIQGKGNGLILLLHGGPGTGKTLTAESVAEIAEKPLYRVTCGDIGTEPDEVEPYLESVLHLGKIWKGVVLLDEADVFLEQRSLDDLRRNALVSIFLRVLEYYDGILVLTSNRVGTFDEAFKSRIQLALHYPKLDQRKRTKVWENFIDRLDDLKEENIDFNDLRDNVEELAKNKMNGREIRNAITLARQYTQWKKTKLNLAELQDIIKISGQFDVYLSDLNSNVTQDQLAQEEGWRLAEADK